MEEDHDEHAGSHKNDSSSNQTGQSAAAMQVGGSASESQHSMIGDGGDSGGSGGAAATCTGRVSELEEGADQDVKPGAVGGTKDSDADTPLPIKAEARSQLKEAVLAKRAASHQTTVKTREKEVAKVANFGAVDATLTTSEEAAKDVGVLCDMFVSNIMPLPPVHPDTGTFSSGVPGAFPVSGRPLSVPERRLNLNAPAPPPEAVEPDVIGGAVVVEPSMDMTERGVSSQQLQAASSARQVEEEGEVLEAKILPERNTQEQRRTHCFFVLGIAVVLTFLAVLLGILLEGPRNEDDCDGSTTNHTISSATNVPFRSNLPPSIVSGIQREGSVYYKANRWMLEDPNLDLFSSQRQIQRFKMVLYYYATGGDHWTHDKDWLSYSVPECEWHTQHPADDPICNEDHHLVVFNMSHNNLTGQLFQSTSIGWPSLRVYDISWNDIGGPPPSIASTAADNLEAIILSHNQFQGTLAGEGFSAFNLRVVKLDSNQLSGYQPLVYMLLPRLEILNVSNNLYDREVTSYFQFCKNLTYLGLADNLFTGALPSELGMLTHLQEIDVSGNVDIDGVIPTELEALSHLQRLDIEGTNMEGSIPEAMCSESQGTGIPAVDIVANCSRVECCDQQ